ncbi:SigE family RNA polymerase sigma factor [Actinoplanes sp. M2I2]|uniref:SigE family RNA polymerase sigma factor n=1 Tax=Actinoplanes sp. M2I2 TaxID=1734444 RepID=UPI002020C8C1|nr:SigE family RNA polymerase sigma factor [Actinoplanes sp. M2I2]
MRLQRGSVRSEQEDDFRDFVAGRRLGLLRTAALLAAGDTHLAEDLVQATLIKVYANWATFQKVGNPESYLRRALVNALIDERRRVWRRREQPVAELPDQAATTASSPGGEAVRRALRELPPRMRAAVVFRYFHGLDVAETAHALECSEGTVKSQTARGLERLRAVLDQQQPTLSVQPQGATS